MPTGILISDRQEFDINYVKESSSSGSCQWKTLNKRFWKNLSKFFTLAILPKLSNFTQEDPNSLFIAYFHIQSPAINPFGMHTSLE